MNLVGISEIAELLGVSRQRAAQLSASKTFPKPLGRIAAGPVWKKQTIDAWTAKHRNLRGET